MKLTFGTPFYDTYEGKLKFQQYVSKKRLPLRKKSTYHA